MNFFIDSANISEITEANDLGIISGVTTNPSLIAKEGIKGKKNTNDHYKKICDIVNGDVSTEVVSTKLEDIIQEGLELSKIDNKIVIKVPIIKDGLKAIDYFSKNNIKTNCTLVFTPIQALLAAKCGATYVSPFLGRLDDWSNNTQAGLDLISVIKTIYNNYRFHTKILGASIRSTEHVINASKIGIDVVTAPFKTINSLIEHPLTDQGLEKFLADYRSQCL